MCDGSPESEHEQGPNGNQKDDFTPGTSHRLS